MPVATAFISPPLGHSIPYHTPHAVSVSLPTWRDNVGYEEGEKRVVESMQTGYPRFFVHRSIQKLAGIANTRLARDPENDKCYLFPTERVAKGCLAFLPSREPSLSSDSVYCRPWTFTSSTPSDAEEQGPESSASDTTTIYAVFMPAEHFSVGKQYWQHTGDGISSRLAEHCLRLIGETPASSNPSASSSIALQQTSTGQRDHPNTQPEPSRHQISAPKRGFSRNKHYGKKSSAALEAIMASSATPVEAEVHAANGNGRHMEDQLGEGTSSGQPGGGEDLSTYIEERYARNLAQSQAPLAKVAMRRRIAGVLKETQSGKTPTIASHVREELDDFTTEPPSSASSLQPSSRGVSGLTEDDVYLYPTGMSAIFHSFTTILRANSPRPVGKSVCFGFPYTDTLKILQKWGPGCHFFGKGLDSDLDALEELLEAQMQRHRANPTSTDPDDQPILSLFAEFPSNPLLRTPDLAKLRQLADRYRFSIVIDETIGGFTNVECLPCADIVVSSLTKVFSGDSNVMGGSLTVNPGSPNYAVLKAALDDEYEDTYYSSDAIFMERNSRDFQSRVARINRNAEAICDFLAEYTTQTGKGCCEAGPVATRVYYPKYITPHNYRARLRHPDGPGAFGGLFSITFTSLAASRAFFDALKCCKGPSLGTNFTLACPYTVLAHYLELEWAAEWEVEEGLVRVSVGLEDEATLMEWFREALEAAERAG